MSRDRQSSPTVEPPAPPAADAGAEVLTSLGRLVKHSFVYGIGIATRPLLAFLMLPIYTRFIRSADYGVLELLNRGGEFIAIAVALGVAPGMMRVYALRKTPAERNEVVGSALLFSGLWGLLVSAVLIAGSGRVSQLLTRTPGYATLFGVIVLTVWMENCIRIPLSHMRAKEKSGLYTAINIARLVAGVGLNVYFLVILRMGIAGIIYAAGLVAFGSWLFLVTLTLRETRVKVSAHDLKQILRFGLPLAVAGIPVFVLHFADRFVLAEFCTQAEIGTYAVGYRLGMLVGVLVNDPFGLAFEPYSYAVESRPDSKHIYSRVLTYHVLAGLAGFVLLSAFGGAILRVMAAPDYFGAERVIPWVAMGYVLYGASNTARLGLMLSHRTELTLPLNAAAAGCNIGLNLLLIPRYGIVGAAVATAASFLFLAVINYAVTYRVYPIPCEPLRLAKALGAAVLAGWVAMHFAPQALPWRLLLGAATAVGFPLLLLAIGFFRRDEVAGITRLLARPLAAFRSETSEV